MKKIDKNTEIISLKVNSPDEEDSRPICPPFRRGGLIPILVRSSAAMPRVDFLDLVKSKSDILINQRRCEGD
jgi:hypothetical protein